MLPLSIDIASNGVIYVGSSNADYYCIKSENNGDSWEVITLPGTNNVVAIETVGVDSLILGRNPAEPIVVHSTDNGTTWECDTITMITNNYITDFEIFNNELYASMYCINHDHGGVYKSNDFGKTWEFDGLLDHQVYSMAFNSKGDLFTGDYGVCGTDPWGVYCKRYGEDEYEHIIETYVFRDMVITKQDYLYFSTDFYIYGSPDYGQTIDVIYDTLGLYMNHICIDVDGFMWCANSGRLIKSLQPVSNNGVGISDGIYERNISVFPNPVDEITTFGYKLKAYGSVQVKIFATDGTPIEILNKGYQNKGSHEVSYNSSFLDAGIYYCSLVVDGVVVETRKMVVVR